MLPASGKSVTIIGAGLAGALLASYLAQRGFRVRVYERRDDPRRAGYVGGRSINLALSARGMWGLEGIGLDKAILESALPMKGRVMHPADPAKPVYYQPYSKNPTDSIKSISRSGLNLALIQAASKHENVSFFFNHRCLDIDLDHCSATLQNETPGATPGALTTVESDLIFGADGAFSPVRARLQKTDRFEYSQSYLSHGYKELHIPALSESSPDFSRFGGFAMDPAALHIWPRGTAMMIALPNPDKTFTCTLFWPFDGDHGLAALRTPAEVTSFFTRNYPDAVPLMPTLADDYLKNPNGSLVTVRCWPWIHKSPGNKAVLLMGDAAHAIVPFFGQGMNAAFEDVRIFCECLERAAPRTLPERSNDSLTTESWLHSAADEYQRLRKPNADAIARMALDNFIEMRDKVGSRLFLQRKKLEHLLHDLFPSTFTPKYNLVSFSIVPYLEALRRGARLDRLIRFLILFTAVLLASFLLLIGVRAWLVVDAILIAAWIAWDRWSFRRDTSV